MRTAARRKGLSFAAHMVYLDQLRPVREGCFAYEIPCGPVCFFLTVALCIGHCWASNAGSTATAVSIETPVDSGVPGAPLASSGVPFSESVQPPSSGQIVIPALCAPFCGWPASASRHPRRKCCLSWPTLYGKGATPLGGARISCPIEPVSATGQGIDGARGSITRDSGYELRRSKAAIVGPWLQAPAPCGPNTSVQTAEADRAFLTIDSGFPLAELEESLRAGKTFSLPYDSTQVPVLFAEND